MEPDVVEADDDLQSIPATVMEDIIQELNQNDAWLNLAKSLKDSRGRRAMSDASLSQMKRSSSPGRDVVDFLNRNLCRVSTLQVMLEQCQLYNILRVINTSDPAVIVAPEEDASYRISLGSKVTLPVEVHGSPYPNIQWYLNRRPLTGKTSTELKLEKFSLKDVGEYTCRIKQRLNGVLSELTSPKYILIPSASPPRVLRDLEDVEIRTYDDMILSFEITGYPEPQCFRWFRDNRLISRTEIPQLTIRAADVHSSGEYHCEVDSTAGSCTTRRALVRVQKPVIYPEKPEIIKQPNMHEVYHVGDQVNLSWEVHCSKSVVFTCFLNNEMLTECIDIHINTSASTYHYKCDLKYCLTKERMDRENWKPLVFKCEASSPSGKVLSDDVNVEVKTRDVKESFSARNKWALLIGNSVYQQMGELPGANNDIMTMQKKFVELGFRVLELTNLSRTEIQNAVSHFSSSFIREGDYVAFFYAGHGIHEHGKDYIIPVDASIKYVSTTQNICTKQKPDISLDECISQVWVTNKLQEDKPALIFSIYDTCRIMRPKNDGYQSHASQETFQEALKNSYIIFATSENYEAYESEKKDSSLLVETIEALMIRKIPVYQLAHEVLENFTIPKDHNLGEQRPQVPKICGDLALPLSLMDPSRPHEHDQSDTGVLMEWENLGGLGGAVQCSFELANAKVMASACWKNESRKDGVTWVISNHLKLELSLSREWHPGMEDMEVQINLSTGNKLKDSGSLRNELHVSFLIPDLQKFENCLLLELYFTNRGQTIRKEMYIDSPAISKQFYRGNKI